MSKKISLPAIEGGKPVRKSVLPYGHQTVGKEEEKAIIKVLRSDFLTTGPFVKEFEEKVAILLKKRYAVAVANGTAALHSAAFAAGIGNGTEAITTPITFLASANCIAYLGGTPKFADIRLDTYNIDVGEIKKAITDRTKAIIPVDFAGQPADYDELKEIALDKDLMIIEDAAHALGAEYHGEPIGKYSDLVTLSFHPVKHITTGEGGMICTDNEEMYNRILVFRNHGMVRDPAQLKNKEEGSWYYEMQHLGYNYRLTDIQCALGLAQLPKLEDFIKRRRQIAKRYTNAFVDLKSIVPMVELADRRCVYHIYIMRIVPERLRINRKRFFDALKKENIGVNVHYIPVHLQPYYRNRYGFSPGDFPRAEEYYDTAITLPIFPTMSDADVEDVIEAVNKVASYYSS